MTAAVNEPLDVPAPKVREHVMLQAREALTRRVAQRSAVVANADATSAGLRAWLERLGHWAMAPQVAMATVLLLMVGIGLYALPFGDKQPRAALTPALDNHPSESAESAAATSAPMAAPEGLRDDVDSESAPEAKQADQASRARSSQPSSRFAPKPALQSKEKSARRSAGSPEMDDALGSTGRAESAKKAARPSKIAEGPATAAEEREQRPFAPAPPSPAPQVAAPKGEAIAIDAYGGGAPADKARAEPAASAPYESAKDEAGGLAEGIRRAQAGDAAGAIRILRPLVSGGEESARQQARLWLARSYRASGDCKAALAHYDVLNARKDAASASLSEAADCYARLGNDAQASALRARLKSATSKP
jgi:hypothetical protein